MIQTGGNSNASAAAFNVILQGGLLGMNYTFGSGPGGISLTVSAAPVINTASTLPDARLSTAYTSLTLNTTGAQPVTYQRISGSLPTGMSVSTAGVISGTPTTAGLHTFAVRATNSAGSVDKTFTILVRVPVTNITGIPTSITGGVPLVLIGGAATVAPANATEKWIDWAVASAGETGATIGDYGIGQTALYTSGAGTMQLRATIVDGVVTGQNYTQTFNITVSQPFTPVNNITGVPAWATAGVALPLSGTASPANATNQTITWSVPSGGAGTTGATITLSSGVYRLNTTAKGTATVSNVTKIA